MLKFLFWSQMILQESRHNSEIDFMTWRDLNEVVRLEQESFSNPWPRISFELSLGDSDVDALVTKSRGMVVGYLIASDRDGEYLIANLAVQKMYRRQGLAGELVSKALDLARVRGSSLAVLEVRESNQEAIRLYERLGFKFVEKNPGYYSLPSEDALVMARRI